MGEALGLRRLLPRVSAGGSVEGWAGRVAAEISTARRTGELVRRCAAQLVPCRPRRTSCPLIPSVAFWLGRACEMKAKERSVRKHCAHFILSISFCLYRFRRASPQLDNMPPKRKQIKLELDPADSKPMKRTGRSKVNSLKRAGSDLSEKAERKIKPKAAVRPPKQARKTEIEQFRFNRNDHPAFMKPSGPVCQAKPSSSPKPNEKAEIGGIWQFMFNC